MLGEIIRALPLLLVLASASAFRLHSSGDNVQRQTCWAYKCSSLGYTCVFPVASNKTYLVSPCSGSRPYCDTSDVSSNVTCSSVASVKTYSSYPGEPCATASDCVTGTCLNKICFGVVLTGKCTSHFECNPGLRCTSEGLCSTLLKDGKACNSDFDCLTSSGCNKGVCTKYLSLPVDSEVSDCVNGDEHSMFCAEFSCVYSYGISMGVCVNAFTSVTADMACTSSRSCIGISPVNSTDEYSRTSACECGMNENRIMYCAPQDGDAVAISFRNYWKSFINAGEVNKCNTARRFDQACIDLSASSYRYTRLMNSYYNYYYRPQLLGISSCVESTFYPSYDLASLLHLATYLFVLSNL